MKVSHVLLLKLDLPCSALTLQLGPNFILAPTVINRGEMGRYQPVGRPNGRSKVCKVAPPLFRTLEDGWDGSRFQNNSNSVGKAEKDHFHKLNAYPSEMVRILPGDRRNTCKRPCQGHLQTFNRNKWLDIPETGGVLFLPSRR